MKKAKQYWDKKAKMYNKMLKNYKPYIPMYEFIREPLTDNMQVLEVGTGTGLVAREIADKVKSVEATDFSEEMIAQAKNIEHSSNIIFSCADVFSLPFSENQFDVVVVANVLHIIPNPEKAMQEIKRVLKPNGLLIATIYLWKELSLLGKIEKFFMMKNNFPISMELNEKEYKDFINSNGFSITKTKKIKASFAIGCVVAENKK